VTIVIFFSIFLKNIENAGVKDHFAAIPLAFWLTNKIVHINKIKPS
jgi:hypothetical protein